MALDVEHECDHCGTAESARVTINCLCDTCMQDREEKEYERGYEDGKKGTRE